MPQGYEAIVRKYRRDYREAVRDYQAWFGDPDLNLEEAIERAGRSLWPSPCTRRIVMFPHQCRQGYERMALAAGALAQFRPAIEGVQTFAELHEIVARAIGHHDRIGDLAIYDIAHRIGLYLGLAPEVIYLHGGTREGARALGIGSGQQTASVSDLPPGLQSLSPAELEDVLCIYADVLRWLNTGVRPINGAKPGKCAESPAKSGCRRS